MRGRYLVSRRSLAAYLTVADFITRLRRRPSPAGFGEIDRILLCVGGHLGDAIISTAALAAVRDALPRAEIGIAASSWNAIVFENHPDVARVHVFDHWKGNRTGNGILARIGRWYTSRRRAVAEVRGSRYDAAMDLYPYYPNMSSLLVGSGIPIRVGFESGGGGPGLSHALPWDNAPSHLAVKQLRLAETVGARADAPPKYRLGVISTSETESARAHLLPQGFPNRGYVVLHPGTGDPRKAWPDSHWLELAERLGEGSVVITGAGAAEEKLGRELATMSPRAANLTGATSFRQLRAIFAGASVVVAADSAAGHLAAAEGKPVVSIMSPLADPERWKPLAQRGAVLRMPVDAAQVMDAIRRVGEW